MARRTVQGFTLIELVIVMVILAILGLFSFGYVSFGAQIFADTSARQQLIAESRFAIERLTRELKYVVPRSVRVSSQCIEFVPLVASSRYLELPQGLAAGSDDFVAIAPQSNAPLVNQWLFVYATQTPHIYAPNSSRKQQIQSVAPLTGQPNVVTFEFTSATAQFSQQSPARRYFIGSSPVSWCYDELGARLWRFANYGYSAAQPNLAALTSSAPSAEVMMTTLINNLSAGQDPFRVSPASLQRNSLVLLDWRVGSTNNEQIQINHEIHLPNVP
jgi:MSHA biogenesis protein MshO